MTAAAAATTAAPSTLMLQLGVRITASNELMVGWLVGCSFTGRSLQLSLLRLFTELSIYLAFSLSLSIT